MKKYKKYEKYEKYEKYYSYIYSDINIETFNFDVNLDVFITNIKSEFNVKVNVINDSRNDENNKLLFICFGDKVIQNDFLEFLNNTQITNLDINIVHRKNDIINDITNDIINDTDIKLNNINLQDKLNIEILGHRIKYRNEKIQVVGKII